MPFLNYYISYNNAELEDVEIQLQDLDTLEDPPGDTINIALEASDAPPLEPTIMESVNTDDDKTTSVKPKRLRIGFNSDTYDIGGTDTVVNVKTFSDGGDGRFLVRLLIGISYVPFIGNMVLDDNSEAFQPRPNAVQLVAADGLNSLRDVELRTTDGELPVGHFSIIEYIVMCLDNLAAGQEIRVIMNLFEEDSNETTSHTFTDIFLDARTFEKDVDTRDDCLTVLNKILDAFGCFISYNHDGWWIIRWDEYDSAGVSVLTHRTCVYSNSGTFGGYEFNDLTKVIAHDQSAEYEGHYLSQDSATIRFQRKTKEIKHIYRLEQPKEVPCNSTFTRGTVDDDVLPLKTYIPECWTHRRGWPNAYGAVSASVEIRIAVHYDANDYEDERYVYLTPFSGTGVDDPPEYLESEPIEVDAKDKIEVRCQWRVESTSTGLGNNHSLMRVRLDGDDGSYWLLGNETILDDTTPLKWWNTSVFTANLQAGDRVVDTTIIDEEEWQSIDLGESPPIPVNGKIYIMLEQFNQTNGTGDNLTVNYSDLQVTYIPYINGTYHTIEAQQHKVSAVNGSRRVIEKEMFISDSPKRLFKGAMKKFDGTNYVLTAGWNDFVINPPVFTDDRLAKFIVYQWWNQYRKTRTVIETDIQGIGETVPGLIHRWKIKHEDEGDKHFMLTSMRGMNFRTCGWQGVFVETSDLDGDRAYDDPHEFKYIQ
jgi:hypothetical protein